MAGNGWLNSVETTWNFSRETPDAARGLAESIGTSPLIAQILMNRGIDREEPARAFLTPRLTDLSDPNELPDIDPAVARLESAIRDGEPTVVYGDYDVDGITGTAVLVRFLRAAGGRVEGLLPNRLTEGYGLNERAVREMAESGTRLLVTVDHGTSAIDEIASARAAGIDVVVLDHHTPPESLPDAIAIVNPHLGKPAECHPCGVGVAFKFLWALARSLAGGPRVSEAHRSLLTEALALVAMGTIADIVPLRGENRIMAAWGLRRLADSQWTGVRALLDAVGLDGKAPTVGDVAFKLAPRINAAGRLGRAELALELLLTEDGDRAAEIARTLDRENHRRRSIEQEILALALTSLEDEYEPGHVGGIALGGEGWHAGVIGIVASRLVDRCHRPVALVAFDGETGRGSCRSISGVNLHEALSRCASHLESFGGHAKAAGFSIRLDRFEAFRGAFDRAVQELILPEHLAKRIRVDLTTPLSSITPAIVKDLERLAPFGEGNPRPVFATRGVRVAGRVRRMGKDGQHLSFLASDGRIALRCVGFRMGSRADSLKKGSGNVDIAYTPGFDTWRGDGSLELELRDVVVSP